MKNLILLLLLKFFVQENSCNDSILSKFHQHGFKLKDMRAEIMNYSEKYFNEFTIKTFKYNRTTPAVNFTLNMKITVKDKIEVIVQGLKFLSNEYRHFPVRFQVSLKKGVDSNALGLNSSVKNCGNIKTFSFEKDISYYGCNLVIDETHFPPLIPNGRYRVDLTFLYLNDEIALVSGFGEVYTPMVYPKK